MSRENPGVHQHQTRQLGNDRHSTAPAATPTTHHYPLQRADRDQFSTRQQQRSRTKRPTVCGLILRRCRRSSGPQDVLTRLSSLLLPSDVPTARFREKHLAAERPRSIWHGERDPLATPFFPGLVVPLARPSRAMCQAKSHSQNTGGFQQASALLMR